MRPGGTLLIFERGPVELGGKTAPFSMIPFLLFFRSFRSPELYRSQLGAFGFRDVNVQQVDLETPFFLVTGSKNLD